MASRKQPVQLKILHDSVNVNKLGNEVPDNSYCWTQLDDGIKYVFRSGDVYDLRLGNRSNLSLAFKVVKHKQFKPRTKRYDELHVRPINDSRKLDELVRLLTD